MVSGSPCLGESHCSHSLTAAVGEGGGRELRQACQVKGIGEGGGRELRQACQVKVIGEGGERN